MNTRIMLRAAGTLLAALMLTACTGSSSQPAQETDITESTTLTSLTSLTSATQQSSSAAQTSAGSTESAAGTTDSAAAQTDNTASGTAQSSATASTAATVSTAATSVSVTQGGESALPLDLKTVLPTDGTEIPLNARGQVCALDGLNLRKEPRASSDKQKLLLHASSVDIRGLVLTGPCQKLENRWLHVRAGGTDGYVSAEYVLTQCSLAPESLNDQQRAALGVILYYQGARLHRLFGYEGGIRRVSFTGTRSEEGFRQISVQSLTKSQLYSDCQKYFTSQFAKDLLSVAYYEERGTLWVQPESYYKHSLTSLKSAEPQQLKEKDGSYMVFSVYMDWNVPADAVAFDVPDMLDFTVVYESSCWKIADITVGF